MDEKKQNRDSHATDNKSQQAVDKKPGEERGKGEKVTIKDLKGKKNDGDPADEMDRPAAGDD